MASADYLLISPDYPPPLIGGSLVYIHSLVDNCDTPLDILTAPLPQGLNEITHPRHRLIRHKTLADSHDPSRKTLMVMYASIFFWVIGKSIFWDYKAMVLNMGVVGNSLIILASKFLRMPVIVVGYAEELSTVLRGKSSKNAIKRFLLRHIYRHADSFIVVCDFAKNLLIDLGAAPEKIMVLPPPYYGAKLGAGQTQESHGHHVLSVGRLIARKGFTHAIDAIALLKKDIPDIRLTIVGGGPDKEKLQEKINALQLTGTITIQGQVGDEALRNLYTTCDLFVLANLMLENGDCEGAPLVFIEAGSFGKPVIGGLEGGTSTMVHDGQNGFTVDPRNTVDFAEKIKLILLDQELAKKMGACGKEKADKEHDPVRAGKLFRQALGSFR